MSSGGGIARFALRKNDSTNIGTSEAAMEHGTDIATATPGPNAFSFGTTNDTNDALSTASDDEFGLLSGGNSFGCTDDFGFQGDGPFGEENYGVGTKNQYNYTETPQNEENTSKVNQSSSSGIPFFRNHVAAATARQDKVTLQTDNIRADVAFTYGTPAPSAQLRKDDNAQVGLSNESSVRHESSNKDSPHVIPPQTTPDGRILPVPLLQLPTPKTPSTLDPTETDASMVSKFTGMAPPPPKRPTTVTPQSSGTTVSTFQFVRDGNQLFQPQQLADSPPLQNSASHSQTLHDQNANDENPVIIEGTDTADPNDITFVDRHQQFISSIQLLQDQDVQYQDMLLEGTMKLNIATSMLLQLKCDMYDLTDQILDELDSVQEYMQDFLPVVESD